MPLPVELSANAEERLGALAALSGNDAQADPGRAVLTACTWTEAYVDALLRALIAQSGYDTVPFAIAMFAELEDRIFQSWPERHGWLARGFGVSITAQKEAADLLALVDLRNALVHGNGSLTDRQCRDITALVSLERQLHSVYQVQVENRRLVLGRRTGEIGVAAAQAYIRALDAEVRRVHPRLRL